MEEEPGADASNTGSPTVSVTPGEEDSPTVKTDTHKIDKIKRAGGVESWRKFFVVLSGKTNGAHESIVKQLKHDGHKEVDSPDHCDFLLLFCPIASRVQSDIENGLSRIPANKPVILVVMHHTFDPNHIVAESRRQVMNQNVRLTVDYLFFEDNLLKCKLNDNSWTDIQKFLQLKNGCRIF